MYNSFVRQVNVNIIKSVIKLPLLFVALNLSALIVLSQTKIVPFEELLKRPVELRSELKGVHPRLFFSAEDLPQFRQKSKGAGKETWAEVIKEVESFKTNVPDVNDEDLYSSGLATRKAGSMTQYSMSFRISQFSFAYLVEGNEKYLEMAKKLTLTACQMPYWGYTTNKPNVDLPPAHLLYAVSFAYDTLYDKFSKEEKQIIREKLIKQARLMYDYFKYKSNKRYTYTQNHTWIPMSGLAIASYVLMDETDEAKDWARLARAVFDRTMLAFGTDGFFYESFHYFSFAFRWMIRYFDAHGRATGENLYLPMQPKFNRMKYFAMHSILPDGENVFDIADIGDGSLNRNKISQREPIYGEYDILYRFADVYKDSEAQTIAEYIHHQTKLETREPMWAFIQDNPEIQTVSLNNIPRAVYFSDNDTVFWRSDWTKEALAFAFRCSPPEGHHAARLAPQIPDWRQNTGHAHPDANSFIIYAYGKYLTGDTGYLGIKNTDDHNTILVNGRGQEKDGIYEMFKEVPNERLDKIRIAEVNGNDKFFYVRGESASGYYSDLGLNKFDRHFLYFDGYFIVWDELETAKPSNFTFMLNADREINLSGNEADLVNKNAALRVIRVSPNEAQSKVIPQMIQARGLPGSVDKGDAEQRGVQLQTTSIEKQTKFEFIHFLQPLLTSNKSSAPKIEKTQNGVQINWANGDKDKINLRDSAPSIEQTKNGKLLPKIVLTK